MLKFNFDYTKTMLMKMFLARPLDSGSEVLINFGDALNIIKRMDELTLHIPKIVYLVGWQYRGHDDRYPDIYEVNESLKRESDASGYDSLIWLINEAKKYNTTVSLHINFADAYEDAELFPKLLSANALIRGTNGKAIAVEEYNGKPCYKVSYKEYWESGLFKEHFLRFIEFLPIIKEQGTLHVDNFQCYFNNNPDIHVSEMQKYRNMMIDYVKSFGIDITSEGVYRECEAGKDNYNCKVPKDIMLASPIATLGKIPALWWLSPYGDNDFLNIPASTLCGGIPGDEYYDVFYGCTHGEDVWMKYGCKDGAWEKIFLDKFARETVPYRFLCDKKCVKIDTTDDGKKIAYFDDGTVSDGRTATVSIGGSVLKQGARVMMPAVFLKDSYIFYSRENETLKADVKGTYKKVALYAITPDGKKYLRDEAVIDGTLIVTVNAYECIVAELTE